MRAIVLILSLACATPAAAQDYLALTLQNDAARAAEADRARQRDVVITNQLSTLEARMQTDQALRDIAAMGQRPALPAPADPNVPSPRFDANAFVSIPDSALDASNARVKAAAQNRK